VKRDLLLGIFDRMTQISIAGILFFLPASTALTEIFIICAYIGFIGAHLIKPDFKWVRNIDNIFLALLFLCMALSLINSKEFIHISVETLFLKWGEYLGLYLIVRNSVRSQREVTFFTGIFLLSAGLVVLSGISQYMWGVEFLRGRETFIMIGKFKGGIEAITSCFHHPNALAAYLIIPFMICVVFLTSSMLVQKKKYYAFCAILTCMLAYCLFYTYSRGAWLSIVAALLMVALVLRKRMIIYGMVLFVGSIILLPSLRNIVLSIFLPQGDSARFEYWQAAFSMIKEHPFLGQGVGTFMANFKEYEPTVNISYAHNCYLQMWAESGLLTLGVFLCFVASILYRSLRVYYLKKDLLLLGMASGLLGYLSHCFFETNLYTLSLAVLFWVWLGIVSSWSLTSE